MSRHIVAFVRGWSDDPDNQPFSVFKIVQAQRHTLNARITELSKRESCVDRVDAEPALQVSCSNEPQAARLKACFCEAFEQFKQNAALKHGNRDDWYAISELYFDGIKTIAALGGDDEAAVERVLLELPTWCKAAQSQG